jgi:pyruvate/2-oxoglutarate dehydrogenase complex dihydrolipoamide acyltransferase (E2) component
VATTLFIPKLGVAMREGNIIEWLVADGDHVTQGQPLYLLETEKVETEIVAPANGTLRIAAKVGETYAVGTRVGEIV